MQTLLATLFVFLVFNAVEHGRSGNSSHMRPIFMVLSLIGTIASAIGFLYIILS